MGNSACKAETVKYDDNINKTIQSQTVAVHTDPLKKGWLQKKSKHIGSWRQRYAVLTTQNLCTFKNENSNGNPTEIISLSSIKSVTSLSETIFCIEAFYKFTKWELQTNDKSEKIEWMDLINKYCNNCIQMPVFVEFHQNNEYNDNFEMIVPYDVNYQYSIKTLIADIIDVLQQKHKPRKFIATEIKPSSFMGQTSNQLQLIDNDDITNYPEGDVMQIGIVLIVDIAVYEHKITSQDNICCKIKNDKNKCPIYDKMKYNYEYTEENLNHLYEYKHPYAYECKWGFQCKAYKRIMEGGYRLDDRCHLMLFKHPPRDRRMRERTKGLTDEIRSFCLTREWYENTPLHDVAKATVGDESKDDYNDGILKLLIREVIENGYKSDLCLRDDEKNDKYTLMKVVDQKLNCRRHKEMGSPLNRAEMLSILLYDGANYDLVKTQRNGNYAKWKWLDYCLYNAIHKLSKREHGSYKIYIGLSCTKLSTKCIESGYFKTYVSASWNKDIALTFADNNGMLFEVDETFREKAVCCDISWISKFGSSEAEILIARSIDATTNKFEGKVVDEVKGIQIVSLRLCGDIHSEHISGCELSVKKIENALDAWLSQRIEEVITEWNRFDRVPFIDVQEIKVVFIDHNITSSYFIQNTRRDFMNLLKDEYQIPNGASSKLWFRIKRDADDNPNIDMILTEPLYLEKITTSTTPPPSNTSNQPRSNENNNGNNNAPSSLDFNNSNDNDNNYTISSKTSASNSPSLQELVASSDNMLGMGLVSDSDDSSFAQNHSNLVAKLLHIIHSWEQSVDTSKLHLLPHQLGKAKDPNDIITFGDITENSEKSNGNGDGGNHDNVENHRENKDNNNSNNNNSNNNNNNDNNHYNNDNNDQKYNDMDGDGNCNVSWHADKLKNQEQEIKRLQTCLQRERQIISRIKKEILSIKTNTKQNEMQTEEKKSAETVDALIVNNSKKLTLKTIPNNVAEDFVNVHDYMNQYKRLHGTGCYAQCNSTKSMVIDYNFHSKQKSKKTKTKSLYVICDKKRNEKKNRIEWKTKDALYTEEQIEELYNTSRHRLPTPMKVQSLLMTQLQQLKRQTVIMLQDPQQVSKLVMDRNIAWNDLEKIPIFGKKSKSPLTLQLSKEEFVKRLSKFANNNINNVVVVPIVGFDGIACFAEIVWIVNIGTDIDININIGISFKSGKHNEKRNGIMPSGIYLNVDDQHKLVPYEQHNCQCLTDFICDIDDLKIGDKVNRWKQKYTSLQDKLNNAKNHIIDISYSEDAKCNDLYADKKIINGYIKSSENGGKDDVAITSLTNKHLITKSQTLQLSDLQKNQRYKQSTNDQHNCQCAKLQKELNDANKHIKSLENGRAKDSKTICEIKSVLLQNQNVLHQHQATLDSLALSLKELQQPQMQTQNHGFGNCNGFGV